MAQYSRSELLAAFRADYPEQTQGVSDNDLFRAIATDYPDIARGISELQQTSQPQDTRTAGQVFVDQAAKFGEGAVETVKGLPGGLWELGKSAVGVGEKPFDETVRQTVRGAGEAIADPFRPLVTGAPPQDRQQWESAAKSAGGIVAGEAVGAAIPGAVRGVSKAATPERLVALAEKAKAFRESPRHFSRVTPEAAITAAVAGPQGLAVAAGAEMAAKTAAGPLSKAAERVAQWRAGRTPSTIIPEETARGIGQTRGPIESPVQHTAASRADEVRRIQQTGTTEKVDLQAQRYAQPEYPGVSPIDDEMLVRGRRAAEIRDAQADELARSRAMAEAQLERVPVQDVTPVQQPYPQNQNTAALETMRQERSAMEFAPEQISPQIQMAREAILKDAGATGVAKRAAVARNTPQLLAEAPELANTPPGKMFDAKLYNAFKVREAAVDAANKSVPPETVITKKPIMDAFQESLDYYAQQADAKAVAQITRVMKAWDALPDTVSWDQFVDARRAFYREQKVTSGPLRDAYEALVQTTKDVSPELAAANAKYSVVRRAIDLGNIDPTTGERLALVGKPPARRR